MAVHYLLRAPQLPRRQAAGSRRNPDRRATVTAEGICADGPENLVFEQVIGPISLIQATQERLSEMVQHRVVVRVTWSMCQLFDLPKIILRREAVQGSPWKVKMERSRWHADQSSGIASEVMDGRRAGRERAYKHGAIVDPEFVIKNGRKVDCQQRCVVIADRIGWNASRPSNVKFCGCNEAVTEAPRNMQARLWETKTTCEVRTVRLDCLVVRC